MRQFNTILGSLLLITFSAFGQDNHDYRTYSIVLDEFLIEDGAEKELIIIQGESVPHPTSPRNLDSMMLKQVIFDDKFQLKKCKSIVITQQEFRSLVIAPNEDVIWDPLYKKYPQAEGVIFLSPIYYNDKDKTTGTLEVTIMRDGLSGGSFLVKFDMKKKRKKITRIMLEVY